MNYSLDPLHAITARESWTNTSNQGSKPIISLKPKEKKQRIRYQKIKKWPIAIIANEFNMNHNTVTSISRKLNGKSGFLNEAEFYKLRSYLINTKIRRPMGRIVK